MKIIIDCDSGIDDLYALTVALLHEDADIIAITVTDGNTSLENGTINTKLAIDKLFNHKKKPVIYMGAEKSLSTEFFAENFFGVDGLGGEREKYFKAEVDDIKENFLNQTKALPHAASKIVELVNQYTNEVTIIALAPLTTIALAYQMCPDFTKNIKKLVIMGKKFLKLILPVRFLLVNIFQVEMNQIIYQMIFHYIEILIIQSLTFNMIQWLQKLCLIVFYVQSQSIRLIVACVLYIWIQMYLFKSTQCFHVKASDVNF